MPRRPRARASLPTVVAACAALAFLVVGVVVGVPFLTREREAHTGTPTPPPFAAITPIVLAPGETACEDRVAVEPATAVVRVLASQQPAGVPLKVTATGEGWRATGTSGDDYAGYDPIDTAIEPAPPASLLATVCVENAGERRVRLQGTTEPRVQARPVTTVDGEVVEPRMSMILLESAPASIADRPGTILEHAAAFKPPLFGSVTIALLLVLALLGVPAAVVFALGRALREDERPPSS